MADEERVAGHDVRGPVLAGLERHQQRGEQAGGVHQFVHGAAAAGGAAGELFVGGGGGHVCERGHSKDGGERVEELHHGLHRQNDREQGGGDVERGGEERHARVRDGHFAKGRGPDRGAAHPAQREQTGGAGVAEGRRPIPNHQNERFCEEKRGQSEREARRTPGRQNREKGR